MATLLNIATGDWLTASTWGVVDNTSKSITEANVVAVTTSYVSSSTFTPGAITISGLALKLANRTGTTGTFSVRLAIAGVEVPGTLVTINTADFPAAVSADLNGGWIFFKFGSSVLLVAATAYTVQVTTSSSNQISLRTLTGTNWDRVLVTTTTQAPVAGDDMIVCGEYLSAGSSNSFTVTYNETATTDYGANSGNIELPGIMVCSKGILRSGVTAATNYNLKLSGHCIVCAGGEFDIGTVGAEMPRDSSFTFQFDPGGNVAYGLTVRNLGTFVSQGLSRTSGKNIYYCKLNTDEAIASTSLGVDTDTGWLDNDEIAVASTTRTIGDCENGALNGNAGASTLTVDGFAGAGGGLAVAHSGTSPTQAEVILLTRNVKIIGSSASLQTYLDIKATATIDCDWTEFKWMGSGTSLKRGIDTACTTGIQSFQYCSIRNFEVSSSRGINMTGISGTGLTFSNNVMYRVSNENFNVVSAHSGTWVADGNIFIRSLVSGNNMVNLVDVGGTFTNNTMVSPVTNGLSLAESNGVLGTFSGNTMHSIGNIGLTNSVLTGGTLSNTTIWRTAGTAGMLLGSLFDVTFDTITLFGCATSSINFGNGEVVHNLTINNITTSGDTTFSTTNGIIGASAAFTDLAINNGDFSTVTGIKTAHTNDINVNAYQAMTIKMSNTKLGGTNEVATQTNLSTRSYISSQKHDQTAGLHKILKRYGNITIDTGTVHAGSQSIKMTPSNASNKLDSYGVFGGFKVAVASGNTVTPTVYVYEDGSYNGARARLIVKRNDALGITADTVLDTATAASDAAWEGLTGTTASVTDDGTLEFVIDCDGTAGNLFVDSFSVA